MLLMRRIRRERQSGEWVFVGGYAGLWKVTFDQNSIKGPLFNGNGKEIIFEARLNQNLDFKAKFPIESVSPGQGGQ